MIKVLNQIEGYIPSFTDTTGKTRFNEAGIVGDQLTVERAVNALLSVDNGFTPQERLEGLHIEVADWHSEMKMLDVSCIIPCDESLFYMLLYSIHVENNVVCSRKCDFVRNHITLNASSSANCIITDNRVLTDFAILTCYLTNRFHFAVCVLVIDHG